MDVIKGYTIAPFDGPLWYIFALLLLVPFSILFYRFKNKKMICTSILVVITSVSFGIFLFGNSVLENDFLSWLNRLFVFIPCYAFGAYLALNNSSLFFENSRTVRLFSLLCAILCVLFLTLYARQYTSISWWVEKIVPVCLLISVSDNFGSKMNKWLIAKYTFFYFAMHQPLINIFNTVLYHVVGNNTMQLPVAFVSRILYIVVILFVCIGFATVCKLILPSKLYKALSGGRS